jgi:hypothetical protein
MERFWQQNNTESERIAGKIAKNIPSEFHSKYPCMRMSIKRWITFALSMNRIGLLIRQSASFSARPWQIDPKTLADFVRPSQTAGKATVESTNDPIPVHSTLSPSTSTDAARKASKFYLEIYGCQMNTNDAEIVNRLMVDAGFERTLQFDQADAVLLLTCAIRESAEAKIWHRLGKSTDIQSIRIFLLLLHFSDCQVMTL